MEKRKIVQGMKGGDWIRKLIFAWLLAVTMEYAGLPVELRNLAGLDGLSQMSEIRMILIAGISVMILALLSCYHDLRTIERWGICITYGILIILCLHVSYTLPFLITLLIIMAGLILYVIYGWESEERCIEDYDADKNENKKQEKKYIGIMLVTGIVFLGFISAWTVARVQSFSTPTFDFGIFAQMFYNMKENGLPLTTVERDGLLSHFHVHVSPIYYLMLPFYCMVPKPETLQVLQAAVVVSGVVPLWKIGQVYRFPDWQKMLLCVSMLFYPAFSGATSYDLHENCFLIPLLLWLFYSIEKRNATLCFIMSILTLMVKEDAAVYVAVIGLWMLVKGLVRKERWTWFIGMILLLGSLFWFFLVTKFLAEIGDGVMTYRYNNFMFDGSASLVSVVKAVLLNPMKAVYESVNAEKINFIRTTMGALLGIPLLTRRYERYILLIPYVLINLMSDYPYQHDIFFQYTFGATAILMYLLLINLADLKNDWKRICLVGAVVLLNCAMFCNLILPRATYYQQKARYNKDYYETTREYLSRIPKEASVTAGTFYTTYLSQREVLYDLHYSSIEHMLSTEYVALSKQQAGDYRKFADADGENGYDNLIRLLEENGYTAIEDVEDILIIYYKEQQ